MKSYILLCYSDMGQKKSALQIQQKIEEIILQFAVYSHISWVANYIEHVQQVSRSIETASFTCREKRRVQKHCHASLQEFHRVCNNVFAATHLTSVPDWMKWERLSEKKEFYKELLIKLSTLDQKTLYLISYALPKGLSSYEEDIRELFRLESEKTSDSDYKTLLALLHSLEAQLRLLRGLK